MHLFKEIIFQPVNRCTRNNKQVIRIIILARLGILFSSTQSQLYFISETLLFTLISHCFYWTVELDNRTIWSTIMSEILWSSRDLQCQLYTVHGKYCTVMYCTVMYCTVLCCLCSVDDDTRRLRDGFPSLYFPTDICPPPSPPPLCSWRKSWSRAGTTINLRPSAGSEQNYLTGQ